MRIECHLTDCREPVTVESERPKVKWIKITPARFVKQLSTLPHWISELKRRTDGNQIVYQINGVPLWRIKRVRKGNNIHCNEIGLISIMLFDKACKNQTSLIIPNTTINPRTA